MYKRLFVALTVWALGGPALAEGSSAYIEQIGAGATAVVDQSQAQASAAHIVQDSAAAVLPPAAPPGSRPAAEGPLAFAAVTQAGPGNQAMVSQYSAGGLNTANLLQNGQGNLVNLSQVGRGNTADLAQNGDGDQMSVAQHGVGNTIDWAQNGSGLSDLGVSQSGGSRLSIRQAWGLDKLGNVVETVNGDPR